MSEKENKEMIDYLLDMILLSMLPNSSKKEITENLKSLENMVPDNLKEYSYPEINDFFDTLYMSSEDIEKAFKKKEDYPTSKEVEENLSKLSDSNMYKDIMKSSFKGIEHFEENKKKKEMVDHPEHYNKSEIETMEKFILINHDRPDKIKGALEFNIIKYSDRVGEKDPSPEGIKEDNDKINFYLEVYELLFPESLEDINRYKVWKKSK